MFDRGRKKKPTPHAQKIEDYALIGDTETAALVGRNGSIDWLCWPTFSSPACFSALLGTSDHGYWKIAPLQPTQQLTRRYIPDTMILETTYTTSTGEVILIDFMPPRGNNSDVVRIVRGIRGKVAMRMELALRFDYGRTIPWVTHTPDGLRAICGQDMAVLRTAAKLEGEGMSTISEFTIQAGVELAFTLTYASSIGKDGNSPVEDPEVFSPQMALDDTLAYWREWSGRSTYKGPYQEAVKRSLMTLKALTYHALRRHRRRPHHLACQRASAAERNWDYRYCWLRDTSFTLLVLLHAGYEEEATAWRRWLLRAIAGAPSQIQTIYGICGERQLTEWKADWLPGFENSAPVNIGNAASSQFQLDVFGEVATALAKTPTATDDIKVSASSVQAQLIDHLCKVWDEPDDGIWETRGGRQHFTHSKVMAWVALDRAIKHFEQYDGGGDVKGWKKNRDLIHKQVCERGFNKKLNSFTQSYGSKELDASCLRIGLVGFLPMNDPRIIGTIDAVQKRLMKNGLVERYDTRSSPDGLPPGEGTFLACSFWMVSNLWLIGRQEQAKALYRKLLDLRNDVGLLSEEWDTQRNRMVGNFPQALSHIALVHSAFVISGAWRPEGWSDSPAQR